jgi:IclR family transcriptional regulator, KDG regulon repressor
MNNYMLQTLSNAIDVLTIFETESEPLSISELVKKTSLNRTTLYRILSTLRAKGLLELDNDTGKYRLGIKIVQMSSLVLQRMSIREVARPYLESLRERVSETIHLSVLNDKKVIYIEKLEVPQAIFMGSYIGWVAPLYCTAAGKVLLSAQNEDYIQEYVDTAVFQNYTQKTLADPQSLREDLERIKSRGYSIDGEEMIEGLTCFSAPIVDDQNHAIAALSISGPTSRMTQDKENIIQEVLKCAQQISQEISRTSGASPRWK